MQEIISILTGIGDLQATLHTNSVAGDDVHERLNELRKTALTILDHDRKPVHAAENYRKDALDHARALGVMIGLNDLRNIPDFTLFSMAAAADNFASSVKTYLQMRNLLAAEKAYREQQNTEVS